ncbi:DUF3168 domain-containing protein [Szabonella alba]|uniref:DUF3168 domain-containing protein n=1 Tax=Szabonella alba TaxID=2804194 RepID=A0A8K0VFC0_9RHOB|nr:DUF3168 domain-containing protein [Szabonella alba]MBL4918282.1 DUF3168 domain-containing protein [Szabonella alba]
MTYGMAAALQVAVYQQLTAAPGLAGVAVLDAMPEGGPGGSFVLIGPEEVRDASDGSGAGAEHRLMISVISDAAGFQSAKQIAVAVSDALDQAPLDLDRGRLVSLAFLRARARRLRDGAVRRIDLTFRARVQD